MTRSEYQLQMAQRQVAVYCDPFMPLENNVDTAAVMRDNTSMSYSRFTLTVTKGTTSFRYNDNDPKRISRKWRKFLQAGCIVNGFDRLLQEEITFRGR